MDVCLIGSCVAYSCLQAVAVDAGDRPRMPVTVADCGQLGQVGGEVLALYQKYRTVVHEWPGAAYKACAAIAPLDQYCL
jgi:hypothetical protein